MSQPLLPNLSLEFDKYILNAQVQSIYCSVLGAIIGTNAKTVANWITSELFGKLNKNSLTLAECKITPEMLRSMVTMIENGIISGKIAKTVFEEMFLSGDSATKIVKDKGLTQVSDRSSIEPIIDEVIAANPDSVASYRSGKDKLMGFFVGQVMQKTGGKASPAMVNGRDGPNMPTAFLVLSTKS